MKLSLIDRTPAEIDDYIRSRLRCLPVPGLPEIRLFRQRPRSGLGRFVGEDGLRPYWAYGWAGGSVLARYILDHPEVVRGRRMVDIGTGSGIVAIAAAKVGASELVAVDIDPLAVAAARLNALENGVVIDAWLADALAGPVPDADVIAVGDLFYEAALARRLEAFLDQCSAAGRDVLIGDPGRAHLPVHRLAELARHDVEDFGQGTSVSAGVYAFMPARPPADPSSGSVRPFAQDQRI